MTICLAAIAKEEDREYVVFATDHMVTTQIGQFEHSIVKYKKLNENTIAMLAGNPLIFDELVKLKDGSSSYETIKKEIFENFKNKRKEIIKNQIFDIFGIDEKFIIDSLSKPIPNPIVDNIFEQIIEFKLETGILLIGFDNGNANITEINEEKMDDFREMNFHAIGSGNIQAANTLLFQKHDKRDPLLATLYNVYKAKRNAEVLQGVGKETELLVLNKDGCKKVDENSTKILEEIYKEELKFGKTHPKLSKINIKELKCY